MKRLLAPLFATALLVGGFALTPAMGQVPKAGDDAMTDPAMKREEVMAFIGVKPGDKVADVVAGRFVRAFSVAVGPKGKLYAVEPSEVVKAHPEILDLLKPATSAPGSNVTLINAPANALGLPSGLDAVFIRQNYHDLYDKFMGPADVPAFNKAVYAALKPGGRFVIIDHSAPDGSGLAATETTHRIDPAVVKRDLAAAGFRFVGESQVLRNPADDRSKLVFEPSVRGKTDQFVYVFERPL